MSNHASISAIPDSLLADLRSLSTASVANAIEGFAVRLRNEGFTDSRIQARVRSAPTLVGHAVTLRLRSGGPAMDGHRYLEGTDWWDAVLAVPAPRVLVVQDLDAGRSAGSFVGQIHAAILRVLGVAGLVTDGAVRDLPELEAMQFPVFSGSVSVSHAYAHIVESGTRVEVAGLEVRPGDWLHGDRHGVISIPPSIGACLPEVVRAATARERELLDACADPAATPDRLRRILDSRNAASRAS
jgi:regulator of RNase E activity RraA